MSQKILKLNKAGTPTHWIDYEEAATAICKGLVRWSLGSVADTLRGGRNRHSGERSFLDLPAIIAVDGRIKEKSVPRISNRLLFARDRDTCLYCGKVFAHKNLSRDHVTPRSRGGIDHWTNCVTCCRRCNHFKADRTPEEAGLRLLAVPFEPTIHEYFYLSNRKILGDQMEFLQQSFKNIEINDND